MDTKLKHVSGAAFVALVIGCWTPAFAQGTTPAASQQPAATPAGTSDETVELGTYVVSGVRASLESAMEIKRAKAEIVDSIVASDINKLPDYNVTDALQRITGVQVLRDRGEGAGVTIRGLSQMENTLNGREVFLAGLNSTGAPSRTMDFANVPAEMVAGLDVYKTGSADHIEGGIGGLIDMKTRRPFDFKEGLRAIGSIRLIRGDLAKSTKPQYSALASNHWKLSGGGEFGALVNVVYQERAWREDQKGSGAPTARTDIIAGQTVNAQNSTSESTVFGRRERTGVSSILQWRPSEMLELYAEFNYTKFNTLQDAHQINVTGGAPVANSATLAPGTSDLQKITWATPSVAILAFARDNHDWTKQYAFGGTFRSGKLTVKFDGSYTDSYEDLYFAGPFFAAKASAITNALFSQDESTRVPSTTVTGIDLNDPNNFEYTGIAYRYRPYYGDLTTGAIDGTYSVGNGFLDSLKAGFRYGKRFVTNKPGLIFADFNYAAGSRPAATAFPNLVQTMPFGFFPNTGTPSIRKYMTGVLDPARDIVPYRSLFGITAPIPTAAGALSLYTINEKTTAAYLMGVIKSRELPIEGNIGLRFARTEESVAGTQTIPATATTPQTTAPINVNSKYNNALPSLNARYRLADSLYLRFAASKSLTRPDFNQLSPSLTLVPNPVNPALNQGSAGNPNLGPIKAENYDLAIEKYFSSTTTLYGTLFYKDVKGFIVSSAATETYDNQPYLITRPRNANPAKIKGFEVGYTQFFDTVLPDPFKGLGVQANYTYIDSETPNATLGSNTPLPNLSRSSYNVVGMYETKKVSFRLAYNWRDKFLSGQANIANVGRIPFYTKAYGWMDTSLGYNFTDNFTMTLEGTNLTRTKRISYYGRPTLPQNVYINDRQFSLSATYRY